MIIVKPVYQPGKYVVRGKDFLTVEEAEFYAVGRMVQDQLDAKPEYAEKGVDFVAQWVVNMIYDTCQVNIRGGVK